MDNMDPEKEGVKDVADIKFDEDASSGSVQVDENTNKEEKSPAQAYPPSKLYSVLGALLLVVLMMMLDSTIMATAIPKITDQFRTIDDIGWYGSAYMLTNACLQPLTGKVYTYFPLTWSYLAFIAVFELGSIICATAVNSSMLVVGRAVAGMGSAGLANGAFTMLSIAAPPHQRPLLLGLIMAASSGGQIIGPLIGGSLTQHATWRWCFWINLPVGGAAALALLLIRVENPARKKTLTVRTFFKAFDIGGFFAFAPACIMLFLALEWGGIRYAWHSATVIGLLCGAAVTISIFIVWERSKGDDAMFPRSLIGRTAIWTSCLTSIFQAGATFLISYYLPLWFQAIKHTSPTDSAVHTLPTFVSQVFASVLAGVLISKSGVFAPWAMSGSALAAIGAGLLSTFKPTTGAGTWIGVQILAGVGRGVSLQLPISAVQSALSMSQMSVGMAVVTWAQFFGGALFVALGGTTFSNLLRASLRKDVPGIDPAAVIAAGATNYVNLATDANRTDLVLAYNRAVTHTYYLSVGAAAAAVLTATGLGFKRTLPKKGKKDEKNEKA